MSRQHKSFEVIRKNLDFVCDSHLLHCIIGADRAGVFASVRRVLKPGGYFLVDTMCFSELTLKVEYFILTPSTRLYQTAPQPVILARRMTSSTS
ncbi:MAG TPA: methyltransferase domain-containing protein [candidate division Zixibacteria bacterium]|nr:methyltransferase domain-containing protein [candidate division Zixibacteria bacterium]